MYNVTILDLPAGASSATPSGINDSGQVVGTSHFPSPPLEPIVIGTGQAVVWNGTTPTVLTLPPGAIGTSGLSINNAGQVAGIAWMEGVAIQATTWNGTTPTVLNSPAGPSFATGISNAGQVVGDVTNNGTGQAVVWNGTTPTPLGPSGSSGVAINKSGQIAGSIAGAPVIWNGTISTALAAPTGATTVNVAAINNAAQVVGSARYGEYGETEVAVIWNGTTPTVLGSLGGSSSRATAINDAGLVVGSSRPVDDSSRGTIWDGTTAIDINTLLTSDPFGMIIYALTGINSSGQIVGSAYSWEDESFYAVLLTPVAQTPLPAALPLFASGLGALWFAGRRRRMKSAS